MVHNILQLFAIEKLFLLKNKKLKNTDENCKFIYSCYSAMIFNETFKTRKN